MTRNKIIALAEELNKNREIRKKYTESDELIHCKDCYFYKEENLQCMNHEGDSEEWYDNDFCSRAERKEE